MKKLIFINFLVFLCLLFLMEFSAWVVIKSYNTNFFSNNKKVSSAITKEINIESYSDLSGITRDYSNYKWRNYLSYLVYGNLPYKSQHINVDQNGIRSNGNLINKNSNSKKYTKTIWVFGSSAIFGATNSDSETVPAYLEQYLNKKDNNTYYNVKNMGVSGYNSFQEYLYLRLSLLDNIPDLIVIINGNNDYYTAWLAKNTNTDSITLSWSNSKDILSYYWEQKKNNNFIHYSLILEKIKHIFSNTLQLISLSQKWFIYKSAQKNPELFKKNYEKKIFQSLQLASLNIPKSTNIYISNVKMTSEYAKSKDIEVLLVQQPIIFNLNKKLSQEEEDIVKHSKLSFFALPAKELYKLDSIPTHQIRKDYFWDFEYYKNGYNTQKKS